MIGWAEQLLPVVFTIVVQQHSYPGRVIYGGVKTVRKITQ